MRGCPDGGGIRTRGKFTSFSGPFCLLLLCITSYLLLLTRHMCKDRQKGLGDEVNLLDIPIFSDSEM